MGPMSARGTRGQRPEAYFRAGQVACKKGLYLDLGLVRVEGFSDFFLKVTGLTGEFLNRRTTWLSWVVCRRNMRSDQRQSSENAGFNHLINNCRDGKEENI